MNAHKRMTPNLRPYGLYPNPGLAKLVFATYSNLQELLAPQQDEEEATYQTAEEESNSVDVIQVETQDGRAPPTQEPKVTKVKVGKEKKKEEQEKVVNSNIISASINNHTGGMQKLPEPITYTLEHKTVSHGSSHRPTDCVKSLMSF